MLIHVHKECSVMKCPESVMFVNYQTVTLVLLHLSVMVVILHTSYSTVLVFIHVHQLTMVILPTMNVIPVHLIVLLVMVMLILTVLVVILVLTYMKVPVSNHVQKDTSNLITITLV